MAARRIAGSGSHGGGRHGRQYRCKRHLSDCAEYGNSPAGNTEPGRRRCLAPFYHNGRSIEVGKLADLVVLSDDYLSVPDDEIRTLHAVLTIIGGEIVHAAAEFADLTTSVAASPNSPIPQTPVLLQNYPNPFNPSTQIQFGLPQDGNIRLVVFNLLGHQVQVLAEGRYKAGLHTVIFEGANLTSGVYLYRVETATQRLTGKMQLLR